MSRTGLALDPVRWFGLDGAVWFTLLLGLVSFTIGYAFILRLKPGVTVEDEPEEEIPEADEEELDEEEDIEEELEEEVEELSEEEEENEEASDEEPEEEK